MQVADSSCHHHVYTFWVSMFCFACAFPMHHAGTEAEEVTSEVTGEVGAVRWHRVHNNTLSDSWYRFQIKLRMQQY